ncbi:hypothetical protein [Nonomuraea sp. NPDC049400]|uniref:hypothetical protein n=1 Tax=Nonomuraea sp. NPDC049400 TaxID=3364352 RepID=UPI0037876AEC
MTPSILPAPAGRPIAVLSWGLGVDSTAILLRWILDPTSREFDLDDLVVLVAQTGDEWPITGELAEQYVLPLLRRHNIRLVQLARTARTKEAAGGCNYTVLDDTRSPTRCYIEGLYKLSDEMFHSGTVPQTGGKRLCSVHAKGELLDWWVAAYTQGRPYTHAVGFELGELSRRDQDLRKSKLPGRQALYPLIDWGWWREDAYDYLLRHLGVAYEKSACQMCPYALTSAKGRGRTIPRYLAAPHLAMLPLLMEHTAVALNERQGLIGGKRLVDELRRHPDAGPLLALFAEHLDAQQWAVYDVRRAFVEGKDGRAASARSLEVVELGSQEDVRAYLDLIAEKHGRSVERDGIHRRLRLLNRQPNLPTAERSLVLSPATAEPKVAPAFPKMWETGLAGAAISQEELVL